MPEYKTDPRYIRSRSSLSKAIFSLAKVHRPDDISIAELTKTAEISRGTFYAHATTPAELLAQVLIEEITPIFSPISAIVHDHTNHYLLQWRDIYVKLLHHVSTHTDIYRHIFLEKPESATTGYLTEYFRSAIEPYVLGFVEYNEERLPKLWVAMATEQQVHNTIVIITSWLETGASSSPESAMNTFMSLIPPWQLAKLSTDGKIHLRRTRALHSMLSSYSGEKG